MSDEKNAKDIPAHDQVLNEALRQDSVTLDVQEAWRRQERALNRPLPEQVTALRKLVASGVELSDEELAAFRISPEYLGATLLHKTGIVRPEDTDQLDENERWSAAYSLAAAEINFYSRTKLIVKQKWITGMMAAWAVGGTTAEAAFNKVVHKQPFWSSVEYTALLFVVPIFTLVWWALTRLWCKEFVNRKTRQASEIAGARGQNRAED